MTKKITKEQYEKLAKETGLSLAGSVPLWSTHKTNWMCSKGHTYRVSYQKLLETKRCSICYRESRRHTEKAYLSLAKKRGFIWLGPLVPSANKTTSWKCNKGHTWKASYATIYSDYGCPYCAGRNRKTKEDYRALANTRGFSWVGDTLPKTGGERTEWSCKNEHVWRTTFRSIYNGGGCPFCVNMVEGRRISDTQNDLASFIGGNINFKEGRLFIDVALPDDKIAIEYDSWYWHASRHEQDAARYSKLMNSGWKVLRIKSNSKLPSKEALEKNINLLKSGVPYIEIILRDWAVGEHR